MIHEFSMKELEKMFYVVKPDSRGRLRRVRLRRMCIAKAGRQRGTGDNVKEGITTKEPGSSRVDDLATFYQDQLAKGGFESAFNIPGIDE